MSKGLSMVAGQNQGLNTGIPILEPCLHFCCIGGTGENTNIDLLLHKIRIVAPCSVQRVCSAL